VHGAAAGGRGAGLAAAAGSSRRASSLMQALPLTLLQARVSSWF
jgi:hypothetical protein